MAWWLGLFGAQGDETPAIDQASNAHAPEGAGLGADTLKPIRPSPPPREAKDWMAEEDSKAPDEDLAVEGCCKNSNGKLLAGVQLQLREAGWHGQLGQAGSVLAETVSDKSGRFRLEGVLRRSNLYQLSAAREDLGVWISGPIDPQLQDSMWQDVVFTDAGTARLQVRDLQGGALAGARLVCSDTLAVVQRFQFAGEFPFAADGSLELRGVPVEGLAVEVSAEGFSTERARVTPGANITLVLRPALSVSGRVVVRGADHGVPGMRLMLSCVEEVPSTRSPDGLFDTRALHVHTDNNGYFRFDGAGEGLLLLSSNTALIPPRNVRAGDKDVLLEIEFGPVVQGTLRGASSWRGARVVLSPSKEAGGAAMPPASWLPVQKDGSFSIAAHGAGPWHVVAEAPGCARTVSEAVMAPGSVELTLVAGLKITGRVLDAAGDPVAGAAVSLRRVVELVARGNGPAPGHLPGAEVFTRSEGDGSFCLANLARGAHELVVSHPSFVSTTPRRVDVVAAGRIPEVVLQRAGELDGLVRLAGGAGDAGAIVLATSEQGERRTVSADGEGRFHMEGLVPGKWRVKLFQQAGVLRDGEAVAVDIHAGRKAFLNLDSR